MLKKSPLREEESGEVIFLSYEDDVRNAETYEKFAELMRDRFKPQLPLNTRLMELNNCRQGPKESVAEFASRVKMLTLQAIGVNVTEQK